MSILKHSLVQAMLVGGVSASLFFIPQVVAATQPAANILCVSVEEAGVVETGRKARPDGKAMIATLRNQREVHEDTPDPTKKYASTEANERSLAAEGSSPGATIIRKDVSRGVYPLRNLLNRYRGNELGKLEFVRELADNYAACLAEFENRSLPNPSQFVLDILQKVNPNLYKGYAAFQRDLRSSERFEGKYTETIYVEGVVSLRTKGHLSMAKGMLHNENDDQDLMYGYHLADRTIYFYDKDEGEVAGYYLSEETTFPLVELNRMNIDHLYLYDVKKVDDNEYMVTPTPNNKCDASFKTLNITFKEVRGKYLIYRLRFIDEDGIVDSYRFTRASTDVDTDIFEENRYEDAS